MLNLSLFLQEDSTTGTDDAHLMKLLNSPSHFFRYTLTHQPD